MTLYPTKVNMPPKGGKREPRGKKAKAAAAAANGVEEVTAQVGKIKIENNRSATGVLTSEKNSRDIKVGRL